MTRLFRGSTVVRGLIVILACLSFMCLQSGAQDSFKPSDPIASIDGEPVYLGELNFLLSSKLRIKDVSKVPMDVQQASSALLIRQHLAMKSLRAEGGESLKRLVDRDWELFVSELTRRGQSIDKYCNDRMSNEASVRATKEWDSAWRVYLRSKMTDSNLKRYYSKSPEKYASAAWNVSHIFIPVEAESPNGEDIAEQRIERIAEQLESQKASAERLAAAFADFAKDESDGATANQGGRIGWVSKAGDLPRAVMEAIRKTDPASVTPPVRSPMGFHLVLVHDKSVKQIPFEQITDQGPLRRDAAGALFDALVARNQSQKVLWYIKALKPPTGQSAKDAP